MGDIGIGRLEKIQAHNPKEKPRAMRLL